MLRSADNVFRFFFIILLLFISACSEQQPEQTEITRPVRAMKVGDSEPLTGRKFPGRAQAVNEVNLAFEVNGTLNKRPVNVGDSVKKGQLLASLDPRDFRSNLKEARAQYQNASANFKRAKELIKKNFISRTEYDRLNASTRIASAELEKVNKALADSEMRAPFSGNISQLYVENFQAIQAKQQIARLVDLSKIEMVIDIPESLISMVPYATNIKVVFDAFPEHQLSAAVKEIGKEASSTTRTYPVTLIMDQPKDIKILPGMAGNASGQPSADAPDRKLENEGIQIPMAAVFSPAADNQAYVWIIDKNRGTVSRQEVTTGRLSNTGILISAGLKPGDWIATAGVHVLREGQKVKIMQDQEK